MAIRGLVRRSSFLGTASPTNAPIYVDSADGSIKFVPGGTNSTVVSTLGTTYGVVTTLTGATDAINIALGSLFMLARTSAGAYTLAAPALADNGREIRLYSGTAFAHTITVAGGIGGAGGTDDVITFTNRLSASITLHAHNGAWYVVGSNLAAIA